MPTKPALSFWQIWNMCFGFLGIQFGFALQNANVSRIFQTLGAEIEDIPILWIAAPVTGLIVQPIVGYFSDRTWGRLGRRRPYFLVGAILATAALFFMPNSPALWIAAGMLWILDASINISMEPFRAFVGDNLPHRQRTAGFAMQSFFIGIGAIVASMLPWMMSNWFGISNTAPEGVVPDSVRFAFYAGGVILFLAVLWTVLSSREYPPEQLAAFEADEGGDAATAPAAGGAATTGGANYLLSGAVWLAAGAAFTALVWFLAWEKELYVLSGGIASFGILQLLAGMLGSLKRTGNLIYAVVDDVFRMPQAMRQLAWVQFFAWFALFAMWVYGTPAVTQHHFGSADTASAAYNDGADWVGVLFAAYNGFAALAAFLIPVLAAKAGRRMAHLACMLCGGAGLASFIFISNPDYLLLSMVGVGIAWASILSVPYAILSSALPAKKMGIYMGIFNFFIVIPQIVVAAVLGLLVRAVFGGQPIYALLLGGACFVLSGLLALRVADPHDPARR